MKWTVTCILCTHQKSYKLDAGIMLIFVSEKNRPLLLAKGVDHCHYQEYTLWLWNITLQRTWYKAYFIAKLFVRKNNREVSLHVKRKRVRVTSHSGAQFRYMSRLCTLLGFASRRNVSADKQGHGHQQMPRQQPIKLVRKHNKNERTLTHWGRVTHICVDNVTVIGLHNGLSPGRRQAII